MKKLIVGAVLALAVVAFFPRPASADIKWNGPALNGMSLQGISWNGIRLNGLEMNGIQFNGPLLQGVKLNGIRLNGPGLVVQGTKFNGLRINGALLQGGERSAGLQCTERGVDFSAVPLAKVTVWLPQVR